MTSIGPWKVLRFAAGLILSFSILIYIGYGLWVKWEQVRDYPWQLRPFLLVFSGILLFIAYGIFFVLWKVLLSKFGERISYLPGFRIWFLSQLGKYVPGKIWGAIGRVFLLRRKGIGIAAGSLSVVYELILMVLSGLIFSLLTLPFWGEARHFLSSSKNVSEWSWVIAGIVLLLGILHPRLWSWVGKRTSRLAGEGSGKIDRSPGYSLLIGLTGCYVALWGLVGLSFCLFVASFSAISWSHFPAIAGIFVFSWIAGTLVFLAPAGLGIREGFLILALGPLISPEFALVAAVASRIWNTVVEMLGIGLGFCIRR